MVDYILSFTSPQVTLAHAGGKGTNLAELIKAGFAVPNGFIVTTSAYRSFLDANHLQACILNFTEALSPEDMATVESVSSEIRTLFQQGVIPAEIVAEVTAAYKALDNGSVAVAVRSSATAEDLPGLAFAGQQDTYLNVIGEDAVIEAVKQCWGSLWTARAMVYRVRNHIPPDEIALAVVVQTMIIPETSGVLFTANPLTGNRNEIVLNASFGLGEAIVSGQVEPDHYTINSQTWAITARKLGTKAMVIVPRADGGTEQIERNDGDKQALSDSHIIQLAQIALRVAKHFGSPQDIEWSLANKQLYLLQSRPITSLYPLPETVHPGDELRIYVNFNAIQGVSDPLTPLGIDALRLVFSGIVGVLRVHGSMREILPEAGSRLFLDFTAIMSDPRLRKLGLSMLESTEPGARQTLLRLMVQERIPTRQVLTIRGAARLFVGMLPILGRVITAVLRPEQVRPRALIAADQYMLEVQQHIQQANSLATCLAAMELDLPQANRISLNIMASAVPVISALLPLLDRWLTNWLGEPPGASLQIMRGLSGNVTIEMNLRLWSVAQRIRADADALAFMQTHSVERLVKAYHQQTLPPVAQQALEEFLREYGMRGTAEIDLGHRRWYDDPTPLLHTLLSYLSLEDPLLAPDVAFRSGTEQAERLAQDYARRVGKLRFGALHAWLLRAIIHRLRTLGGLREVPLFYLAKLFGMYRVALQHFGRELIILGVLDSADDIFFIPLEVLKRSITSGGEDLRTIANIYRAAFEQELARKQMPRVLLSTGETFYEGIGGATDSESDFIGEAVSPGVVEGQARVILDPHGVHLEPGDILVCPLTDPGWTPLFLAAGGLVMDIGGMMTHGSIVAREYGIPAVVGVHQATTRIKTGQRLRVDGNRGRVTIMA